MSRRRAAWRKKLMMITYAVTASTCLVTIACTPLILKIYSVSAEALALGMTLIMIHNGCAIFLWPTSFAMPNILRAANDVRYPMVCSIISMLGLRLVAGYILAVHFGMGAIGIWIAMIGDWLCRSICFFLRLKEREMAQVCAGITGSRRTKIMHRLLCKIPLQTVNIYYYIDIRCKTPEVKNYRYD